MEHTQSVTRLCENLASIVDRFDGLAEASRNNSYEMFRMFCSTAEEDPSWVSPREHTTCCRYQMMPRMLVDAGFYIIGRGHFSVVLGHEDQPDTAFKLSLKPEDSYVAYAMYCRQNPGLHLPEIRCMIRAREGQIIAIKRYATFFEGIQTMPGSVEFPHASYNFMQYWRDAEINRRDYAVAIERNPIFTTSYINALVAIGQHFDGAATFDLHSDNLMYDVDTDRFIITDPVSFKKENFHAIERPRKNSDRTDHFAAAQARAIIDASARGIGARVEQVRRALPYWNPCEVPQCSLTSTSL